MRTHVRFSEVTHNKVKVGEELTHSFTIIIIKINTNCYELISIE